MPREAEAREAEIQQLQKQQQEIADKLSSLTGQASASSGLGTTHQETPELLMHQLKTALAGKKEEDPNKMLLKALSIPQNRLSGEGGTNSLKPAVLNSILSSDNPLNMAEWLANLNKQEEGELELSRAPLGEGEPGTKQGRARSGILDRATANIQQKQVWPQQNLGEDWADEDVEFKQMKFEHMVAGESRTIETCSDPAEILGRFRLLRRIAYLKLRGYEWFLIRKMYAAILTSIDTKEYSWESNFDRFETILYRRAIIDNRSHNSETNRDKEQGRKQFCRDFNKPEGCPRNSPHTT